MSTSDPGVASAVEALLDHLQSVFTTERGVQVESIVTALGAFAGHASQKAGLDAIARGLPGMQGDTFVIVGGANGDRYIISRSINRPLAMNEDSAFVLVNAKLSSLGAPVLDAAELLANDEATAGTERYGRPRYPDGLVASDVPRGYLGMWPAVVDIVRASAPSTQQWPTVFATAMCGILERAAAHWDIHALGRVFMDSAIAMSRLELFTPAVPENDELVTRARAAAPTLLSAVMTATTTQHGVHLESLVTALGALAGRACHLAAVDGISMANPAYANMALNVIGLRSGETLFAGDAINRPLAESQYSVWGLTAGKAQQMGFALPELAELFTNAAQTMGTPDYGRPRFAPDTNAGDTPQGYLRLWNDLTPTLQLLAPHPQQWPIAFGLAIQQAFDMTKGQFDLTVLTRVVMDSAIAISKLRV